jgi:hypothetical protein
LKIDLPRAVQAKLTKNGQKYPAEQVRTSHCNLFADRASKGSRASGNGARTGSPRSRATCRYSEATST